MSPVEQADRSVGFPAIPGGNQRVADPEAAAFVSALHQMSACMADIHAALSAVRASLALTIACLYEGGKVSVQYEGDEKRIIDRNLEYRLELSEGFERMSHESLALEAAVSSWRKQVDELTANLSIPVGGETECYFSPLLKRMETRLGEIHISFCLFLAKSLFLKSGLEFSNDLFGLSAAEGGGRSHLLTANIYAVIEDAKKHSRNPELAQLGVIMDEFVNAQAAALSSFEIQSVKSLDDALSDCESLIGEFMMNACILATDHMP